MAKKKYTVDELTRLAFIYAEADRLHYAECDHTEAGKEAAEIAAAMRAYRLKRWGRTEMEARLDASPLVPITEIGKWPGRGKK